MYAQTRTENSGSSPNAINVQLCGEKLDKKDTFGKSGIYNFNNKNNFILHATSICDHLIT